MSKNIKFFLIFFFLSLFFWQGINIAQKNVEDFFYAKYLEKNPSLFLLANIAENYSSQQENLQIEGISAISVEVKIKENRQEKILFKKAESKKMPIASLTKLMTSMVASEFYSPDIKFRISKEAVGQEEETGNLRPGEILSLNELLKLMLIESSNDAAFAVAELISKDAFVELMNLQAKNIGMENTYFFNPTGLDPENEKETPNFSTVEDLVKFGKYLLEKPEILDILSKKEYELYLENGVFHHTLKNTNELLGEIPQVIGGKTGYTEKAGGCLILILKRGETQTYLINVILNSPDKFQDMRKLIEYIL